jgi:hypothetical protein
MRTIAQELTNYKRGTIRGFSRFVESGLVTPKEVEFIANGAMIDFLDQILRSNKYQVKKDK